MTEDKEDQIPQQAINDLYRLKKKRNQKAQAGKRREADEIDEEIQIFKMST